MDPSNGRARHLAYLWSRHPLVMEILQKAINSDEIECVSFSANHLSTSAGQQASKVLIVDTCSVVEWTVIATEWHEKHGLVVILVPQGWGEGGVGLRALSLGVCGIISISQHFETELSAALRSILNGYLWLRRDAIACTRQSNEIGTACVEYSNRFTSREQQVLGSLMDGLPNKVIALKLRISERTVKYHVSHILKKLHVLNRKELFLTHPKLSFNPPTLVQDQKRPMSSSVPNWFEDKHVTRAG